MTRVIYKYEVPVDDEWHEMAFPGSARIVHVQAQNNVSTVNLWAEIDTEDTEDGTRNMRAFATGQPIPEGATHIGTTLAGPFVWHVYAGAVR